MLINSCAYFKLKQLDKHNFSENNIYDLVSKEYKEFANFELYEMHDEIDANYFAYKAINTIKTKTIKIENPNNWNIPDNYKDEAKKEYQNINILLAKEVIFNYPELIAKLVSGYDCWLEQIEENWQLADIKNCKNKFTNAYKQLISSIAGENSIKRQQDTDTETDSLPKENNSYFLNNEKTKTILVYFDYDSFLLSSVGKEKLDNIITNSLKKNFYPIIIYGHTDTKGSKDYNLILSKKRALSVSKYFKENGVNNKLIIKNYGEKYPFIETGDNISEEKNRRAEIIIKN